MMVSNHHIALTATPNEFISSENRWLSQEIQFCQHMVYETYSKQNDVGLKSKS